MKGGSRGLQGVWRSAEMVQFSESSRFFWMVGTGWWPKTEKQPGWQRKGWFEL